MKKLMPVVSAIALALVIVPSVMYFADSMDKLRMQALILAGTALWFATAPLWMGGKST